MFDHAKDRGPDRLESDKAENVPLQAFQAVRAIPELVGEGTDS